MNEDLMEKNELNQKSMGGTELIQKELYNRLPRELLEKFQIWFSRYRPEKVNKEKYQIFFAHDLPNDPESAHLKNSGWDKFDKLIFVSNWQMQAYIGFFGIPYSKCVVIKNAINPIFIHDKFAEYRNKEAVKIIYHTTPHRGLELLVSAFEEISKTRENVQLDVYSSFKLYGWEEKDKQYEPLFDRCRNHPKINYYGTVSNEEIKSALVEADIFAYPSIWLETSCISLIEAMSAGCLCIHPNIGALAETSANWTNMYQFDENNNTHIKKMIELLNYTIENPVSNERLLAQKQYIDNFYSWEDRQQEWEKALQDISKNPKISSQVPMFIYRT